MIEDHRDGSWIAVAISVTALTAALIAVSVADSATRWSPPPASTCPRVWCEEGEPMCLESEPKDAGVAQ